MAEGPHKLGLFIYHLHLPSPAIDELSIFCLFLPELCLLSDLDILNRNNVVNKISEQLPDLASV